MYKLLHGNCLELIKNIPDESIDLILTDIPFNISINEAVELANDGFD